MKRTLIHWVGLFGPAALLSYAVAVVFSPLAYPGYDWMRQAVSDLSAANAPSLTLWNRLSCIYGISGILTCMIVCIYIQGKLSRILRLGIYLFTVMNWISYVGFGMFPLSDSGYAGTFQDVMHMVTTVAVVILSIASLVLIMIGGYRKKFFVGLANWAALALGMMMVGSIGTAVIPAAYFGIVERFSVFAAVGFVAVLGVYVFLGTPLDSRET